jgi:hypothetical protein
LEQTNTFLFRSPSHTLHKTAYNAASRQPSHQGWIQMGAHPVCAPRLKSARRGQNDLKNALNLTLLLFIYQTMSLSQLLTLRNLGVILYKNMSFVKHVSTVFKSCFLIFVICDVFVIQLISLLLFLYLLQN